MGKQVNRPTKEAKDLYFASKEWKDLVKRLTNERKICAFCGKSFFKSNGIKKKGVIVQGHHTTYNRFGAERDTDIAVLHRSCHEMIWKLWNLTGEGMPILGIKMVLNETGLIDE